MVSAMWNRELWKLFRGAPNPALGRLLRGGELNVEGSRVD